MLKTSRNIESITRPRKSRTGIDNDSKAKCDGKCKLNNGEIGGDEVGSNKIGDDEFEKNDQKTSKSKKLSKSKKMESSFLTSGARLAFIKLRQAFVKALILYYFNLDCYIWIKMDTLGYAIGGVLT